MSSVYTQGKRKRSEISGEMSNNKRIVVSGFVDGKTLPGMAGEGYLLRIKNSCGRTEPIITSNDCDIKSPRRRAPPSLE